jgi:hypothetical protein
VASLLERFQVILRKIMRLIIPDIHNKVTKLATILQNYDFVEKVTSLGDWHDSFEHRTAWHAEETARIQKEFIENPNHDCLFGNHDIQYAFPKALGLGCSGSEEWKFPCIRRHMTPEMWKKVKLVQYLYLEGKTWILSHAGLSNFWAHPINGLDENYIVPLCEEAIETLEGINSYINIVPDIVSVGRRRGGRHLVGGVTWCDYRDFVPTPQYNQVFGHTIGNTPRKQIAENSENYCIDTNLDHVAILEDDGKLTIEAV